MTIEATTKTVREWKVPTRKRYETIRPRSCVVSQDGDVISVSSCSDGFDIAAAEQLIVALTEAVAAAKADGNTKPAPEGSDEHHHQRHRPVE